MKTCYETIKLYRFQAEFHCLDASLRVIFSLDTSVHRGPTLHGNENKERIVILIIFNGLIQIKGYAQNERYHKNAPTK